jgi:DivIVA domain-containing protein
VVSGEASEPDQRGTEVSTGSPSQGGGSDELGRVPSEIREVSFPVSLRGYDRRAVDAYVDRVKRLIAELELTRSPEAAVTRALEQVGEQTSGILQRAGETAEAIAVGARQKAEESTARASQEAEETVASAKSEADEILNRSLAEAETILAQSSKEEAQRRRRSQEEITALRDEAEARMRELHADTEAIRAERRELLDDLRAIAARVEETAAGADRRFPPQEPAGSGVETLPETESEAETQTTGVPAAKKAHNGAAGRRARPGR